MVSHSNDLRRALGLPDDVELPSTNGTELELEPLPLTPNTTPSPADIDPSWKNRLYRLEPDVLPRPDDEAPYTVTFVGSASKTAFGSSPISAMANAHPSDLGDVLWTPVAAVPIPVPSDAPTTTPAQQEWDAAYGETHDRNGKVLCPVCLEGGVRLRYAHCESHTLASAQLLNASIPDHTETIDIEPSPPSDNPF